MSHYEISPREREDEQRRDFHEFDEPYEDFWDYLARLSERPRAGNESSSGLTGHDEASHPGTGRSESREEAA